MTHEPARYRDGEILPAAYDEAVAEEAWTACRQLLDAAQPDLRRRWAIRPCWQIAFISELSAGASTGAG